MMNKGWRPVDAENPRDPRDLTADPARMEAYNRMVEEAELDDMCNDDGYPDYDDD